MEDSDWRSADFRQKMVSQIEDAMRKSGIAHSKTSKEIENDVFMEAKTKDEYISGVENFINQFQDIQNEKSLASVSDPMNALQNLTGDPPAGPGPMGMASRPQGASLAGMSGFWHPMTPPPRQQPLVHADSALPSTPNIPASSQPSNCLGQTPGLGGGSL